MEKRLQVERVLQEQEETLKRQMEFKWNLNLEYTWTEQTVENLRKKILAQMKDSRGNNITIRLLLFGLTGHGKSTLCNSFRTALSSSGYVSQYSAPGSSSVGSYTTGFRPARCSENLWIIDMGGIHESHAIRENDITDILEGKVPFYTRLTENLKILNEDTFIPAPPGTNDVSCVIIVMKPGTELGDHGKRQMHAVDELVRSGVIARHLVITHLDNIDPTFTDPKNLPGFAKSAKVQEAVKILSERMGISPAATHVVRNYVKESHANVHSDVLLLSILDHVIHDAREAFERSIDLQILQRADQKDS